MLWKIRIIYRHTRTHAYLRTYAHTHTHIRTHTHMHTECKMQMLQIDASGIYRPTTPNLTTTMSPLTLWTWTHPGQPLWSVAFEWRFRNFEITTTASMFSMLSICALNCPHLIIFLHVLCRPITCAESLEIYRKDAVSRYIKS